MTTKSGKVFWFPDVLLLSRWKWPLIDHRMVGHVLREATSLQQNGTESLNTYVNTRRKSKSRIELNLQSVTNTYLQNISPCMFHFVDKLWFVHRLAKKSIIIFVLRLHFNFYIWLLIRYMGKYNKILSYVANVSQLTFEILPTEIVYIKSNILYIIVIFSSRT